MNLPHPDALHDTNQAAEALRVPAAMIRRWRRAGDAMPAGMMPAPVPGGLQALWKLAELEPLAARYHDANRRQRGRGRVRPGSPAGAAVPALVGGPDPASPSG